ncbi:MAG: LacI family DNA-binding transcriptional regulator [Devosia sp.]
MPNGKKRGSVDENWDASGPATLADVARRANVAKSTVSRALSNDPTLNIREETRARIKAVAAELQYVPNPTARSLRLLRSWSLAFVVPELDNPVFGQTIEGAHRAAVERNYSMLIAKIDASEPYQDFGQRLVLGSRVDGILLNTVQYPAVLKDLKALNAKVVLVNRRSGDENEHSVMLDNAGGAVMAVAHLVGLGHRKIAYIAAPPVTSVSKERLAGYRRGLAAAGLRYNKALVAECEPSAGAAEAAARAMLACDPAPTAVVAWNLAIAAGVTRAALSLGVPVPEALSVIALNDAGPAEMMTPAITAVQFPLFRLGWQAASTLIDLIEGLPVSKQPAALPPISLRCRESTGPVPNG